MNDDGLEQGYISLTRIIHMYIPRTEEIVLKIITAAKISNKFSRESQYISNTLWRGSPYVWNVSFLRIFMCDMTHSEVTSLVDGDDIRSHMWKSHVKEHGRSCHACEESRERWHVVRGWFGYNTFVDDLVCGWFHPWMISTLLVLVMYLVDTNHSYGWFVLKTMSHVTHIYTTSHIKQWVTSHIYIYHSYEWFVSHIYICIYIYVYICVTWLIFLYDVAHLDVMSSVDHDDVEQVYICLTWIIHMCIHVWRDSLRHHVVNDYDN